jgi:selenide,water dikinase
LWPVLHKLPLQNHPDLIVGTSQVDDSGVVRVSDDKAIILTVDFFPAIVDDPYVFGQVAAANAMSDVYAMGGEVLSALNIIGFPEGKLEIEALELLMKGGADKVNEAGGVIVGGHTLVDSELKYGLSIVGIIHPDDIVLTAGAKPGDAIVLTKPLGTGIYSTAMKNGALSEEQETLFVEQMTALNRPAARAMVAAGAHACTDVTGFGLIGHALEMAVGSDVTLTIDIGAVPLLPEAVHLASHGVLTGGGASNIEFASISIEFEGRVAREQKMVLHDPQTSGGLLISLPSDKADALVNTLRGSGAGYAAVIGEVIPRVPGRKPIIVRA